MVFNGPEIESKTAYEIETELGGSGPNRTGFGGRPKLINFYMEDGDVAALPVLDKLDVDALCCGKTVPVLTVLDAHGGAETRVCGVKVTKAEGVVTEITFVALRPVTFTVASGTWAIDEQPVHDNPGSGKSAF